MKADLTLSEFPGRAFTGTLARTAQSIDVASRTLLTEIDVENPKRELLPGSYAEVHLKLPGDAADVQAAGQRDHLPHRRGARRGRRRRQHGGAAAGDARTRLRQQPRGRVDGIRGNERIIINAPDSIEAGQKVRVAENKRRA